MKSFKLYKNDPRPMTPKRFFASLALGWIFVLIPSFIIRPLGIVAIPIMLLLTIVSFIVILWRISEGKPAFPNQEKSEQAKSKTSK